MLKKIAALVLALMLGMFALIPMATASADSRMYISASNGLFVNVRNLPAKSGSSKVLLGPGFPVTVKEYDSDWSEVTVKVNGKTIWGYVSTKYLSDRDPATRKQSFKSVDSFTVTVRPSSSNGKVNLWPSASKKGDEIRTLSKGERLTVISASNAWFKVIDSLGNTGYVAKAYVKK